MQGIGDEEDMKEDIEIEESEKEIYNKKAIKATENRPGMEEINREGRLFSTHENDDENKNDDDDDDGEIDEKEDKENDEVFEEQSKNTSNIEKNEKDTEMKENEGEKTCEKKKMSKRREI